MSQDRLVGHPLETQCCSVQRLGVLQNVCADPTELVRRETHTELNGKEPFKIQHKLNHPWLQFRITNTGAELIADNLHRTMQLEPGIRETIVANVDQLGNGLVSFLTPLPSQKKFTCVRR